MKRPVQVQIATPASGLPGESDTDLGRLRARVREHHLLELRAGQSDQPLGQQTAQHRRVGDGQVGQIHIDDVVQSCADMRVIAPDEVDAAATQQIEESAAVLGPEVRAVGPGEDRVHAGDLVHVQQLRMHMALGQVGARVQVLLDELVERHARWSNE